MDSYKINTKCVQAGYTPGNGEPRQIPIIQSTTFKYDTSEDMGRLFDLEAAGYFYTRLQNPTNDFVAAKIAALEGGSAAMLTSSGQAANFFALFNICECGSHIVSSSSIYGGTFNLISVTMAKMGIEVTFVSPDCTKEELEAAFKENTRAVFGETIANPALTVLDLEKFEKAVTENQVEMFILCSPHNPVCRVWTEEELDGVLDICKRHNVLVLADEIHQDFAYDTNPFVSTALVKGGKYKDILIILNAASKTFNLAGLIHSHVIIYDEKLMEKYDAYIKSVGSAEANLMGLTAVEAAYRGGEEWFDNVKALIRHNYDYMKQEFAKELPKIVVTPLEGTYLSWIDLRGYIPGKEVEEFIQKKCRLACDVGEWFSFTGHGFIRINLATDTKNIRTAVERIITNIKERQ